MIIILHEVFWIILANVLHKNQALSRVERSEKTQNI